MMNNIMQAFTPFEMMVITGVIVLLSLVITEIFDVTHLLISMYESKDCNYGYGLKDGPHIWKQRFPRGLGRKQSPVNIVSDAAICVPAETMSVLCFSSEYFKSPKDMKVYNDGHTASIYASWENNARPKLRGGPLCSETYVFFTLLFRWGPNDTEGSEHMLDSCKFALEMQAIHVKEDCNYANLSRAAEKNGVLIVSYFYQVTPVNNPYLQPIIDSLKKIRCPFNNASVEPVPLSWIMPPFKTKFFSYCGSLTHPPCTEGVKWIIQPELLGISSRQLKQFRKLMSVDGASLDINTRPVQEICSRDIFYYD